MGDHAPHGGDAIGTPAAGTDDREEGAEALAYGRWLFAQPSRFIAGAATAAQLPESNLPEVAFAGRSNVGKSSLLNALTGRSALARTSRTPGRTQQINFFVVGESLMLADLPGYGYARAAKGRVKAWTALARAYLRGRAPLRRVCLLIDARHGPKPADAEIMDLLDQAGVSFQAILTKADCLDAEGLNATAATCAEALARRPAAHPSVIATSARTGIGIERLRAALGALARPRETD